MSFRDRGRRWRERAAPAAGWAARWGPAAGTALFLLGVGWMTVRHEMWRDELQAWLIARDSPTPLAVLRNTRYEGHPWLWHLLLWIPSRFTGNPAAMQVVHGAVAGGTAFLLLRFAPFPGLVRVLLAGGYFFAYEWAVIARNYALSALLFFVFAALYGRRWRNSIAMGLALAAACLTNIHSIILVLALAPVLAVEYAVAWTGGFRRARESLPRALAGLALVAAGLWAGIRAAAPPPDSGYAVGWQFQWSADHFANAADRVIRAYVPLPVDGPGFWNSNRLLAEGGRPDGERPGWAVPPGARVRTAALILLAGALCLFRRPWAIVPYLAGSAGLVAFSYVKYMGAMRHAGFQFLWFVVSWWMSRRIEPWRLPGRRGAAALDVLERATVAALSVLLAVHARATWIAGRLDARHVFSQARAAALYLRDRFPDPDSHTWCGAASPEASSVVAFARLKEVYYLDSERAGSFVIWDRAPRGSVNDRALRARVDALRRREGKPVVLISDRRLGERGPAGGEGRFLAAFEGSPVGENYYLYEWPAPP